MLLLRFAEGMTVSSRCRDEITRATTVPRRVHADPDTVAGLQCPRLPAALKHLNRRGHLDAPFVLRAARCTGNGYEQLDPAVWVAPLKLFDGAFECHGLGAIPQRARMMCARTHRDERAQYPGIQLSTTRLGYHSSTCPCSSVHHEHKPTGRQPGDSSQFVLVRPRLRLVRGRRVRRDSTLG